MRDIVCIYTGQGAAGDFKKIAIYTGQFSSCSPVVMFNEKTCIGGLYHLPGKGGDATKLKNDQWGHLETLLHLVKPTKIHLFPCGDYSLRQSFIEGNGFGIAVRVTDEDYDDAGGDMDLAMGVAFDRVHKGDQRELNQMFAQAKAAETMAYSVELETQSYTGIQVTADDQGKLSVVGAMTESGGTTYNLKKGHFPPKTLCAILNPNIDYSLWYG
jgi:hypothetical protein